MRSMKTQAAGLSMIRITNHGHGRGEMLTVLFLNYICIQWGRDEQYQHSSLVQGQEVCICELLLRF